jgi:hypothetical protein
LRNVGILMSFDWSEYLDLAFDLAPYTDDSSFADPSFIRPALCSRFSNLLVFDSMQSIGDVS